MSYLVCWRRGAAASLLALIFMTAGVGCGSERPAGPDSGPTLFHYCEPCHGADGSGNKEFAAPAIAGLADWYVQLQLEKFRSGLRGAHPSDAAGLRMRPMARSLASEEMVATLAAHVASLPPTRPQRHLEGGDVERGKGLYQTCAACHGAKAEGNQQLKAPNLAHLDDWYLLDQLKKMKSGVRGASPGDSTGSQMRAMAQSLPDEQAMLDVVTYISSLGQ